MQVRLLTDRATWRRTEAVVVWVVVLNDTYEDTTVDRRLLVGPTPVPEQAGTRPFPVSVEPSAAREDDNMVPLRPFCLYGRQREFGGLPAGRVRFHGYLLKTATDVLLPHGPQDGQSLLTAAEPLEVTVTD